MIKNIVTKESLMAKHYAAYELIGENESLRPVDAALSDAIFAMVVNATHQGLNLNVYYDSDEERVIIKTNCMLDKNHAYAICRPMSYTETYGNDAAINPGYDIDEHKDGQVYNRYHFNNLNGAMAGFSARHVPKNLDYICLNRVTPDGDRVTLVVGDYKKLYVAADEQDIDFEKLCSKYDLV